MSYTVPYSFIPGTKARAQEVNANFNALTEYCDNFESGKANTSLSNLSSDGIDVIKNNSLQRNIGEIVTSAIPLTDAGLHLLDGSLLSGSGSYSEFVDYIADLYDSGDYPDLFDTEANWQSAVTDYGVCGKFVYNSTNNTVRLPKYSNKIYTSLNSTVPVVGNGTVLGLTNGTDNYGVSSHNNTNSPFLKVTTENYNVAVGTAGTGGAAYDSKVLGVTTDGTKSGIIAKLSNITTSLDGYYYIVVATSSKTDVQVDIDEIATDLNGKADTDLSNVPNSKSILTESYVNGTSWYRVYSDGWCEQGGQAVRGTTVTLLKPYTDTNYARSCNCDTLNASYWIGANISNITANGFTVYAYVNGGGYTGAVVTWQTAGYIR